MIKSILAFLFPPVGPKGAAPERRQPDPPVPGLKELASPAEWNDGFKDSLHEVFRITIEHDSVSRDWLRLLLTIQASVVVAIWTVISLSERIPYYKWLVCLILLFGLCTTGGLLGVIGRLRRWQKWFTRVAQRLQHHAPFYETRFGNIHLYPVRKEERAAIFTESQNDLPKPGRAFWYLLIPIVAFTVIQTGAVAYFLISPMQPESRPSNVIHLQVGSNQFEVKFEIKEVATQNPPSIATANSPSNTVPVVPPPPNPRGTTIK